MAEETLGQNAPDINAPMPGTPSQPTATAAPTPAAQQIDPSKAPAPPPPGSFYSHLSHAFMGAVLGGLSGGNDKVTGYDPSTTDPKTGGPTAITRPKTTHEKLSEIAGAALRGLAAGSTSRSQDPTNPGGTAFGSGSTAQHTHDQQQDLLKRQQSAEEYKTTQDALLRRGEIARNNALTTQAYLGNLKATNDLDPHFAENSAIIDAARKSPELEGHVKEITGSELKAAVSADPNFLSNHIARPLGLAPTTNEDGPLLHEDGITPMQHMRYGIIDGTKDGNMPVTPQLEAYIEQYGGKLLGSKPKVGDNIPIEKFIPMLNALDTEKMNTTGGWQQSTVGMSADGKTPVEINGYNHGLTRPLQTITADNAEKLQKGSLSKAQADEAEGKAAESRATAAALMGGVGGNDPNLWRQLPEVQGALAGMPPAAQAIMKTVNPVNIRPLMLVANGDAKLNDEFPASPRPKTGQMSASQASAYLQFFNPKYNEQLFGNKQNLMKDFLGSGSQTSGGAISQFNNFLNHSAEVIDASNALARNNSPWLQKPLNEIQSKGLGVPGVGNLNTAIMAARNEWQTFIHNGHAPTAEETAAGTTLMNDSSTPAQIAGALGVMGKQAIGRLDTVNEKWKTLMGTDYPNLVTPMGRTSAGKVGVDVSAYKSGGMMPGAPAQPPAGPDPSTHPHKTAADGKTVVFKMEDGTIRDAQGQQYDPNKLVPLQGAR